MAQMFTLVVDDEVVFLGPWTHSIARLKTEYKLTDSQAREAVLQALFNAGDSVDISTIKKIACEESKFYSRNAA
jgi:hypothetical protein